MDNLLAAGSVGCHGHGPGPAGGPGQARAAQRGSDVTVTDVDPFEVWELEPSWHLLPLPQRRHD